MRFVRENTTLVQASELRTRLDEILSRAKASRVVVEKHHKPVAVLLDLEEFERIEQALEDLSDLVLALEARTRERKAKAGAYVPLEKVEKSYLK